MRALILLAIVLPFGLFGTPPTALAQQRTVDGLAVVNDDASLSINGTLVRLYGIVIPKLGILCLDDPSGRFCSDYNVARKLERHITGFVHCDIQARSLDGAVEGLCSTEGRDRFSPRQDIGAWLVNQGLAVARRDAPADYDAYQQIAKARRAGIWSGSLVPELDDRGNRSRFY